MRKLRNFAVLFLFVIAVVAVLAGLLWLLTVSRPLYNAARVLITLITLVWFVMIVKNREGFFVPYKFFISLFIGVVFFFAVLLTVFGIWAIAIGMGVSMIVMVWDIEGMKKQFREKK